MAFSNRRGRPKSTHDKKDLGTPELIYKRMMDYTTEPIDLCLKKGLITTDQHNSGIYFRVLYRIVFGKKLDVSANNFEELGSLSGNVTDEEMLSRSKTLYCASLEQLTKAKAKRIVMNCCIFNQRPAFLLPYKEKKDTADIIERHNKLLKFQEGLDILVKLYNQGSKNV